MDWMFYVYVFLILFGFVVAVLTLRMVMNRRIERFEEKRRMEKETRQTAETNSGL